MSEIVKALPKAFPTEFPKDAAAKIGAAILNREFSLDLLEPAYDLLGYALGRVFGSSKPYVPTVGADPNPSDDHLASMLFDAANAKPSVKSTAPNVVGNDVDAIPWTLVIPLVWRVIAAIIKRKRDES